MPAYDIDTVYCNERTEAERKQMELFIKLRKERFLGRGALKMREASDKSTPWVRRTVSFPYPIPRFSVWSIEILGVEPVDETVNRMCAIDLEMD